MGENLCSGLKRERNAALEAILLVKVVSLKFTSEQIPADYKDQI